MVDGNANYEKGILFESLVASQLERHQITYQKHKFVKGRAKRWNVDFYSKPHKLIIECKNVLGKNLSLYLEEVILKSIDILSKLGIEWNFICVVPVDKLHRGLISLAQIHKVKFATLNSLSTLLTNPDTNINNLFIKARLADKILKTIFEHEGLNKKQIARKVKSTYSAVQQPIKELEDNDIIVGVGGRGRVAGGHKRYYLKCLQETLEETSTFNTLTSPPNL